MINQNKGEYSVCVVLCNKNRNDALTKMNKVFRNILEILEEPKEKRFYDTYVYNDLVDLFHAEIQKFDNYYKYDESLTPAKFQSQITTFGQIQPRNYDPSIAET